VSVCLRVTPGEGGEGCTPGAAGRQAAARSAASSRAAKGPQPGAEPRGEHGPVTAASFPGAWNFPQETTTPGSAGRVFPEPLH